MQTQSEFHSRWMSGSSMYISAQMDGCQQQHRDGGKDFACAAVLFLFFFLLDQTEASGQLLNINELSIDDTLMMYEKTNCQHL